MNSFDDMHNIATIEEVSFGVPRRSWQQRLVVLVAVLVIALLVGTSVLVFIRSRPSTVVSGSDLFTLPNTWKQVAFYSGTGSKIISGINVELSSVWSNTVSCVEKGKIDLHIEGLQDSGNIQYSSDVTNECIATQGHIPISPILEPWSTTIQTITVIADPSITWYIQFAAAKSPLTFAPSSQWVLAASLGESGSMETNVLPPLTRNGQAFQTTKWALALICIGTGSGSAQLDASVNQFPLPVCDGQVSLHPIDYASPTQIQRMQVTTTGNILWSSALFACANTDTTQCSV